jgi:hypothetical protein
VTTDERYKQGADLIRQAFKRARDSGLPEWRTMTTAVLKNRLLDLTDRSFRESDWGAESLRDFVEQFDDVISVVPGVHPLEVTLVDEGVLNEPVPPPTEQVRDFGARRRVRSDLWKAVLDFTSGSRYIWDGQKAVPCDPAHVTPTEPELPTLNEEELKSWRSDFVREQSEKNASAASLLYGWLERGEALMMLPTSLRAPWIVELKSRVIDRLHGWFDEEDIPLPADFLVSDPPAPRRPDTDVLRERVLAAVRDMSRVELESLQLPATVLLRSKG